MSNLSGTSQVPTAEGAKRLNQATDGTVHFRIITRIGVWVWDAPVRASHPSLTQNAHISTSPSAQKKKKKAQKYLTLEYEETGGGKKHM
jgi:hypothetical protein